MLVGSGVNEVMVRGAEDESAQLGSPEYVATIGPPKSRGLTSLHVTDCGDAPLTDSLPEHEMSPKSLENVTDPARLGPPWDAVTVAVNCIEYAVTPGGNWPDGIGI